MVGAYDGCYECRDGSYETASVICGLHTGDIYYSMYSRHDEPFADARDSDYTSVAVTQMYEWQNVAYLVDTGKATYLQPTECNPILRSRPNSQRKTSHSRSTR